jgi:hypothetical protein
LEKAVLAVSSDQAMDKKQGPVDSAGGASKPIFNNLETNNPSQFNK